jgi:hypothetical protein
VIAINYELLLLARHPKKVDDPVLRNLISVSVVHVCEPVACLTYAVSDNGPYDIILRSLKGSGFNSKMPLTLFTALPHTAE